MYESLFVFTASEKMKNMEQYMGPFYLRDRPDITLDSFGDILENALNEFGVPHEYGHGTISTGLFSAGIDSIFLACPYHHDDYFNFAFTVSQSATTPTTVINVYVHGKSKQLGNQALANTKVFTGSGASAVSLGLLRGGSVGIGFAVGGALSGAAKAGIRAAKKGFGALIRDDAALADEQLWYSLFHDAVESIFS